jgi:hypothetical protein
VGSVKTVWADSRRCTSRRRTTRAALDLGVTGAPDIATGAADTGPAPRSRSHRWDVALALSGASGLRRHRPCFCQPPGGHVLSNLAIAVAAVPGARVGSLVMNLAPAPVGMARLVLRDGTARSRRSGSDRSAGAPGCAPPGCPGVPRWGGSRWRAVPAACRPEIAYTGGGPVRWRVRPTWVALAVRLQWAMRVSS